MTKFSDINFKYTDAEEERMYAPQLLDAAFVDINDVLEKIYEPEKYLVIGPKGSGKTALSSKLKLLEKVDPKLYVENDLLEQFEFQLLKKTGGTKGASIGGALTTWQVILLIRMLTLFHKDPDFRLKNYKIVDLYDALKKYGLAGSDSLIEIIQYTSRRGIFANLKAVFAAAGVSQTEESSQGLKDSAALLASVKNVLNNMRPTSSKYFLVLDGLDYILREGRSNCTYIADMINAARQVNLYLASLGINAKVVVLIRNEILQILPDS